MIWEVFTPVWQLHFLSKIGKAPDLIILHEIFALGQKALMTSRAHVPKVTLVRLVSF